MFFVLEFAQQRFTLIHLRHMESVVFDFDPFTETSKQVTRLFEIRPDASWVMDSIPWVHCASGNALVNNKRRLIVVTYRKLSQLTRYDYTHGTVIRRYTNLFPKANGTASWGCCRQEFCWFVFCATYICWEIKVAEIENFSGKVIASIIVS